MTVPGVNVICAATFMAAVGDIRRFPRPRASWSAYLGLDPKVRQSGDAPGAPRPDLQAGLGVGAARAGRGELERRPPARARCTPSTSASAPAAATQVAIVATARKLACLFWCLLTREEDYAFAQPSLTAKKLRRLELTRRRPDAAGRRAASGRPTRRCATPSASSPSRPRPPTSGIVNDWQASSDKEGRERDTGARI